jgi:hypothetical protein
MAHTRARAQKQLTKKHSAIAAILTSLARVAAPYSPAVARRAPGDVKLAPPVR